MSQLTDAILYVPDFPALVAHLDAEHPEMLLRDESGTIVQPPEVTGFARTPAAVNGDRLLVYARLRDDEVEAWRGMAEVEVLAEAPYAGAGTGKALFDVVFADPDLDAKYKSVHDYTPYESEDEDGNPITVTPTPMFGMLAGA
ncbi:hypothetical protein [Halomonas smyrnensis]|uniref:hypothetical protein n=1 Tax=Halomonas smyrnensis TaxID=720605 RepID=UPI0002DA1037|nr:hypothetical protein [Halomonas smyrnensis]